MENDKKKSSNPLINHYNLINVFTYDKYFFSSFLTTPTAFYAVLTCQEMSRPCFLESAKNAFFAFIFPFCSSQKMSACTQRSRRASCVLFLVLEDAT